VSHSFAVFERPRGIFREICRGKIYQNTRIRYRIDDCNASANAQYPSDGTPSTQSCLRFDDVLKLSSQRDPGVIIAKAQETEADAEIKDAKSLFRPQLSAFGRSGFGDTGIIDSSISNQAGLRASQRIFDFGDSKYARQAATSGFEASLEDTRQAQLQAAQQTGLFYLELIEAEEQIELTKRRRTYFAQQLTH